MNHVFIDFSLCCLSVSVKQFIPQSVLYTYIFKLEVSLFVFVLLDLSLFFFFCDFAQSILGSTCYFTQSQTRKQTNKHICL